MCLSKWKTSSGKRRPRKIWRTFCDATNIIGLVLRLWWRAVAIDQQKSIIIFNLTVTKKNIFQTLYTFQHASIILINCKNYEGFCVIIIMSPCNRLFSYACIIHMKSLHFDRNFFLNRITMCLWLKIYTDSLIFHSLLEGP